VIFMKLTSRRLLVSSIFITLAALIVVYSILIAPASRVGAEPVVEYETNEVGLTYGSGLDVVAPGTEPDMILALATNGVEGYVYVTDLDYAMQPYAPKNPEEAGLLMQNEWMPAAFVFAESVKEQTGAAPAVEEVAAALQSAFGSADEATSFLAAAGEGVSFDGLADSKQALFLQFLPAPGTKASYEVAQIALEKACTANDKTIPVYEVDGTTVIGEFIVGSG
jgi:hypothetical protein